MVFPREFSKSGARITTPSLPLRVLTPFQRVDPRWPVFVAGPLAVAMEFSICSGRGVTGLRAAAYVEFDLFGRFAHPAAKQRI